MLAAPPITKKLKHVTNMCSEGIVGIKITACNSQFCWNNEGWLEKVWGYYSRCLGRYKNKKFLNK
jgi:hypothetical protein